MLVDGVEVEYRRLDGTIAGDRVRLIDFENAAANNWAAVNQFTTDNVRRISFVLPEELRQRAS